MFNYTKFYKNFIWSCTKKGGCFMRNFSRITTMIWIVAGLALILICFILFHLGGIIWEFSQLTGAFVGGSLTLYAALTPMYGDEDVAPWLHNERLAWILIGCGSIAWGIGESIWRYYVLSHQSPFPSFADIGYSLLPPLVFIGLLLQPFIGNNSKRRFILIDSMIAMGSLLSIGWYLLLGSLALDSSEDMLAKYLGLYYPTTDIALLSCVVFLLLRWQGARYQVRSLRIGLLVVGIGLGFFSISDFIFNIQQNAGTYVDGTWIDLGWPIGLLLMGIGAYCRRFLPQVTVDESRRDLSRHDEHTSLGLIQIITYILVAILFFVLCLNIFATDTLQVAQRAVLLLATIAVVALVVVRQILTILDNDLLAQKQEDAFKRIEIANKVVEDQAVMIAKRNSELEKGIQHLKDVQARMANGHLQVRARLVSGDLLPLAASLNLMAERLQRLGQTEGYAQAQSRALSDLTSAFDGYKAGKPFQLPLSCNAFPEIKRLLTSAGFREGAGTLYPASTHNLQPQAPPKTLSKLDNVVVSSVPSVNARNPQSDALSSLNPTRNPITPRPHSFRLTSDSEVPHS
jgi:hypothetical protein